MSSASLEDSCVQSRIMVKGQISQDKHTGNAEDRKRGGLDQELSRASQTRNRGNEGREGQEKVHNGNQ